MTMNSSKFIETRSVLFKFALEQFEFVMYHNLEKNWLFSKIPSGHSEKNVNIQIYVKYLKET